MKNLKQSALALGLLIGGVAIGQALSDSPIVTAASKTKVDFAVEAKAIIDDYRVSTRLSQSAPQTSQVANEATAQLLYIQAKQNAEIIRLLNAINNKK
ncbi:hypothetical protein ACFFLM_15680 [Deinococcus oregonensis]|uniref:Uncharacterized protein n=1 Tax=Deinococcus oregonensis TaxID=1805970 RepID=A0ABV6B0X9_9DEIO